MWTRIKWGFRIALLLILFLFFYYVLPRHDIVQITNTYNRLTTVGANWLFYASPDVGTAESTSQRDIRFIEAVDADGDVIVYRNEDTGWVWPPYFKYDSSNLQAEATAMKTSETTKRWAVVTKYGWRFPWLSTYSNAVNIRAATGPDERIIPWVNIVILTFLAFIVFMLRRMWLQFRERSIDPALAEVSETFDEVGGQAEMAGKRAKGWLASWRKKS
jgi:hypothetical protein